MILDQHGRPITTAATLEDNHQLSGGWQLSGGLAGPVKLPDTLAHLGALGRRDTQKAAIVAWYLNPLLYGAVEVIKSFVLGAGLSYGEHPDPRVQEVLESFWDANDVEQLAERWFTEYLLLGECLTVFPDFKKFKARDQAARIGMYGVVDGELIINGTPGLPGSVETIKIGANRTLRGGEFVWSAHDAILGDARGWPIVARALGPALAYLNFSNARINVHQLASRINAVYYAFAKDDKELAGKSARFRNIPRNGSVLTLGMNEAGVSEKFELVVPDANAIDSASDGKLIKQLLAVALGLPEHYLAEGGGVTRTTADSMGQPARKGFQRRQRNVWRWLQATFRAELARRYPGETFRSKKGRGGKRVPASGVEFPVVFPSLENEDLAGLISKVNTAAKLRLASLETLRAELGYDPALEREKIANEAKTEPAPPTPAPKPEPEQGEKE